METQQCWFFSSSSRRFPPHHPNSVHLRYVKESEEVRRAMQPLALIQRAAYFVLPDMKSRVYGFSGEQLQKWDLRGQVREIEQESFAEPETVQHKEMKQTAAIDLSKRLTNVRTFSDPASVRALEEWRKRKLERARQREMGKNATSSS